MTTRWIYHKVWLEDGDDAAEVTMPDTSVVTVTSQGRILVHDRNGVVISAGSLYTHVKPAFTNEELALALDAVMSYYHSVQNAIINDGTDLPGIEALQRKIESILAD
jgi:hypothetical protein